MRVLTRITLIGIVGITNLSAKDLPLVCTVADVSLYSTTTHKTAPIKSNQTYTIDRAVRASGKVDKDALLVNGKIYHKYNYRDGITSYLRGKLFLYHSKGRYYMRKVGTDYTTRLICKDIR